MLMKLPRAVERKGHCCSDSCLHCAYGDYSTCLDIRLKGGPRATKRSPFDPRSIALKATRARRKKK